MSYQDHTSNIFRIPSLFSRHRHRRVGRRLRASGDGGGPRAHRHGLEELGRDGQLRPRSNSGVHAGLHLERAALARGPDVLPYQHHAVVRLHRLALGLAALGVVVRQERGPRAALHVAHANGQHDTEVQGRASGAVGLRLGLALLLRRRANADLVRHGTARAHHPPGARRRREHEATAGRRAAHRVELGAVGCTLGWGSGLKCGMIPPLSFGRRLQLVASPRDVAHALALAAARADLLPVLVVEVQDEAVRRWP